MTRWRIRRTILHVSQRSAWLVCGVALFVSATVPTQASGVAISVFGAADGTNCYVNTGPGQSNYIVVQLGSPAGISGAEFSISGLPPEYLHTSTPNPLANVTIGDPFGDGCQTAFSGCQSADGAFLTLFSVSLLPLPGAPTDFTLHVNGRIPPGNPNFNCPLVTLCDAPTFTKQCVGGGDYSPGPRIPSPANPSPPDHATNVEMDAQLAWELVGRFVCCGIGTANAAIHFGTDPAPPLVYLNFEAPLQFDPGPLLPETTYYWSVSETPDFDCGMATSPVWSFTTSNVLSANHVGWDAVKALYR